MRDDAAGFFRCALKNHMIDDAALLERRETRLGRAGARMKKAVSADADNRSRARFPTRD